jgi:hypothetical protein
MVRHRYEPQERGWIAVWNTWHELMCAIDCTAGGAQRAFDDLCIDFARAGWELQDRSFDSRYISRNSIRWNVMITQLNPLMRSDESIRTAASFPSGTAVP